MHQHRGSIHHHPTSSWKWNDYYYYYYYYHYFLCIIKPSFFFVCFFTRIDSFLMCLQREWTWKEVKSSCMIYILVSLYFSLSFFLSLCLSLSLSLLSLSLPLFPPSFLNLQITTSINWLINAGIWRRYRANSMKRTVPKASRVTALISPLLL